MRLQIFPDKEQLGAAATDRGAQLIRQAIGKNGRSNIIVATGASQFEMLAHLVAQPEIRWDG